MARTPKPAGNKKGHGSNKGKKKKSQRRKAIAFPFRPGLDSKKEQVITCHM